MTRLLLAATLLIGCDQPSSIKGAWTNVTSESACEAASDLMARLSQQKVPPDAESFFNADVVSVSKNCARVDLANDAGYGSEYLVLRLAGYAVWTSLLDADIFARRGVFVDAARAANECIGLGVLVCDLAGWEAIQASMTIIK